MNSLKSSWSFLLNKYFSQRGSIIFCSGILQTSFRLTLIFVGMWARAFDADFCKIVETNQTLVVRVDSLELTQNSWGVDESKADISAQRAGGVAGGGCKIFGGAAMQPQLSFIATCSTPVLIVCKWHKTQLSRPYTGVLCFVRVCCLSVCSVAVFFLKLLLPLSWRSM